MQVPHVHIWYFTARWGRGCVCSPGCTKCLAPQFTGGFSVQLSVQQGLYSSCVAATLNLTPQGVFWSQRRPTTLYWSVLCAPQLVWGAESAGGCLALELTASLQCVNSLSEAFPLFFLLCIQSWPIYFEIKTLKLKRWTSLRMWGKRQEVVNTATALCRLGPFPSVVGNTGAASSCRVSTVCKEWGGRTALAPSRVWHVAFIFQQML